MFVGKSFYIGVFEITQRHAFAAFAGTATPAAKRPVCGNCDDTHFFHSRDKLGIAVDEAENPLICIDVAACPKREALVETVAEKPLRVTHLDLQVRNQPHGVPEGLVDFVMPCNFYGNIRFDISADQWRAWIGNRATVVISGADSGVTENGCRRLATIAEYRKWAESMRRRGAKDGLYLYNLFGHSMTGEVWDQILTNGL